MQLVHSSAHPTPSQMFKAQGNFAHQEIFIYIYIYNTSVQQLKRWLGENSRPEPPDRVRRSLYALFAKCYDLLLSLKNSLHKNPSSPESAGEGRGGGEAGFEARLAATASQRLCSTQHARCVLFLRCWSYIIFMALMTPWAILRSFIWESRGF